MALVSSPVAAFTALRRHARATARRLLGADRPHDDTVRAVPDDLPRDSLFAQPLVVTTEVVGDPEDQPDGGSRVTFRALVRDADGKRCADVHVEARVTGPDRTAVGEVTTDMLGAARFRMTGPPGEYAIEVLEVAALALEWDRGASTTTTTARVE